MKARSFVLQELGPHVITDCSRLSSIPMHSKAAEGQTEISSVVESPSSRVLHTKFRPFQNSRTLAPAIPMATRGRSLHARLGGGAVADVLLWRRSNASVAAVVGATAVWFVFERAGYSVLSVLANALLLLVAILFFWAKSASLLNRPLPPIPNLEVSDAVFEKAADHAVVWINRVLAVGHDIAIKRDRKVFMRVILILWVVSYVGMAFNFLTLIYIGVMLSLLVPPLYEKYQDHVDEKLGLAHSVLSRHLDTVISRTGQSTKQKKTE